MHTHHTCCASAASHGVCVCVKLSLWRCIQAIDAAFVCLTPMHEEHVMCVCVCVYVCVYVCTIAFVCVYHCVCVSDTDA